jgi:adenosylcobinamide kinase/adenosylcobinamide-phosphate guanylyltransferase
MLTLILGGARSGKSRLAQKFAAAHQRVVYIATAQVGDDPEMAARIAHHRSHRPAEWRTVEAPLSLAAEVEQAVGEEAVLVDCLTVWLSNLFWEYRSEEPDRVQEIARAELLRLAAAAQNRHVILVSNELGSGTVPEAAITRAFRDAQGLLNQWAAELAGEVILTIAGLPMYLKAAPRAEAGR